MESELPGGLGRQRRAALAATALVALAAAAIVVLLARGGGSSDQQAVRAWFGSAAGGGAPAAARSAIHVGTCSPTDATSGSYEVLECPLTTDAPTPMLHTCFVISGGQVLRGGWQLSKLDACDGLRFDARTGTLVDLVTHSRYRLRT